MKLLAYNFIKKETLAKVFSCLFYEISKKIFLYRTPQVSASKRNVTFKEFRLNSFTDNFVERFVEQLFRSTVVGGC